MRLANHGLTMDEIAEEMALPATLASEFFNRDYYGTISHNTKAVYQRYLGWFDGNPAHLHPHPPVASATRYVEFMGGAAAVLTKARGSFDAGDYRWVAQVVNHVVFADPENQEARLLQADALEQLGYQAESGPWRAFYLTGAQELRHGAPGGVGGGGLGNPDVVRAMTVEMILDYLGVRLNGPDAAAHTLRFNLTIHGVRGRDGREGDERWHVGIEHGVLNAIEGRHLDTVDASIACTHGGLVTLATAPADGIDAALAEHVEITGDAAAVRQWLLLLDRFHLWFPLVTP